MVYKKKQNLFQTFKAIQSYEYHYYTDSPANIYDRKKSSFTKHYNNVKNIYYKSLDKKILELKYKVN